MQLHATPDKVYMPNQLVTIRDGKYSDFAPQDLVNSIAAVRAFLRKNNL